MAAGASEVPPVLSTARVTMLAASLLVSLASGTNYVFSAYSPQLGARLHINHTRLNIVGLAGNMGVYTTSPLIGRFVDAKGPKMLLVMAFVFLLGGYMGLKAIFDSQMPAKGETISTLTFLAMIVFSYITGAGGNAGLTSSMNSTAKTFPERARASTTGIVISGFGLSAFVFSLIAHREFPGDTSSFLLVLALGTSLPMIVGFFLVRPIPLPVDESPDDDSAYGDDRASHSRSELLGESGAMTPLLSENLENSAFLAPEAPFTPYRDERIEMSPTRSRSPAREPRPEPGIPVKKRPAPISLHLNIRGTAMFSTVDFWLLFSFMSLLSGTGIMYINNVGSISQALYANKTAKYDEVEAAGWQSAQVSTISVMSFCGRIAIGLIADLTKDFFHVPRSYSMVLIAALFTLSQIVITTVADVQHLWIASVLLGLAYGQLFGLAPTICIEYFGLPHFSENWGYVALSPLLGGNLFSLAFGRNLDAHTPAHSSTLDTPVDSSSDQCLDGRACYVDTIYLTCFATVVALGLSLIAGWRDRRRGIALNSALEIPRSASWVTENEEA